MFIRVSAAPSRVPEDFSSLLDPRQQVGLQVLLVVEGLCHKVRLLTDHVWIQSAVLYL